MTLVFTEDWIDTLRGRYQRALLKPPLYYVALEHANESVREQIEEWVTRLPDEVRNRVISLLRNPDHFVHTYHELAVGSSFERYGYRAYYEPNLEGQTPDWLVETDDKASRFLVEVFTADPTAGDQAQARQLDELTNRLERIEIPVALILMVRGNDVTLNSGISKEIARQVKEWLVSEPSVGKTLEVKGIKFEILNYNPNYSKLQLAISVPATWVKKDSLRTNIQKKIAKYKRLGMLIVVAVVPDFYTGLDLDDLDDVLLGQETVRVAFDKDTMEVLSQVTARRSDGLFDQLPELSAVMWVCHRERGKWGYRVIRNPSAARPLQADIFMIRP